MPTQEIADKVAFLQSQVFDPGQPSGDETITFDFGFTQSFEFAQIWFHRRVGAFECHGAILSTYLAMGGPTSRLGYPTSDELDDFAVPGGRLNTFEFGRLRWELTTGVSVELDEMPGFVPWVVVKLNDDIVLGLGAGQSLSLADFAQLLAPFLPEDALEPLEQLGIDLQFTRAWEPVTPEELQGLVDSAAVFDPEDSPPNLESFLHIVVPDFIDPAFVADSLNQIPSVVELAYVASEPSLPSVVGTTNPQFPSLGYLRPAPEGVDALRAWQLGADGSNPGVLVIEKGWFFAHEDLPQMIRLHAGENSPDSHYHGTAVLGVLVGMDNTVGGVGLAPAATCNVMSWWSRTTEPRLLASRIIQAIFAVFERDILLIEAQLHAEIDGVDVAVPAETDRQVFEAIRMATRMGVVVIEAAGNGGSNLDHYRAPNGLQVLNRDLPFEFRDSRAIVVGAASSTLPRFRHPDSNFGNRVDCHSWGDGIAAPGALPVNDTVPTVTSSSYWPANPGFGFTSGATAIIAGVALLVQDLAVRLPFSPGSLSPGAMRRVLSDLTIGTPTSDMATAPIGPQPDIARIVATELNPGVFLDPDEVRSWAQRPLQPFNFHRASMQATMLASIPIRFAPVSAWFPTLYTDALRAALEAFLDPTGSPDGSGTPAASWGASPVDFYHGHVMIPVGDQQVITTLTTRALLVSHLNSARTQAEAAGPPDSEARRAKRVDGLLAGSPNTFALATTVLLETSAAMAQIGRPVTIVWHTFEQPPWRPTGMQSGDPRRHWRSRVPVGTPHVEHEPMNSASAIATEYAEIMEFTFMFDPTLGHFVVTPDVIHGTAAMVGVTEAAVDRAIHSTP